jgi:dTDP-4-dehydrorhamnose reductase
MRDPYPTLVFGSRGYLGQLLLAALPGSVGSTADIADLVAVRSEIRRVNPVAVINAAGKTGRPNVDWCETHQTETMRSNVTGALNVAEACAEAKTYLLHLGSGCIFYGPSPSPGGWLEDDHANPTSFYSRSKYAADLMLSKLPNVGIARLRMPIGDRPDPRNLITKLAGYTQVVDVGNSVTVVSDLIRVIGQLVELRAEGVFHVVNPGVMRHRDLLRLYQEEVSPGRQWEFIEEEQLVARGLAAKTRSNCILASPRLKALGIELPPIEQALPEVIDRYAHQQLGW